MPRMTRAKAICSEMTLTSVRKNGSRRYLFSQPVPNSPNRLKYATILTVTNFSSKIFDMDVYNIAKAGIVEIPQMIEQVFPIYDLIRVPHEVFQKPEFFERERDFFAFPCNFTLCRIEFDIADRERLWQRFARSSQEGLNARVQFCE